MLQSFGKSQLKFITLTFPGSTSDALKAILENASEAVRMLTKYVKQSVSSPKYCYCWEFQKRGALHLHYMLHVSDECAVAFTESQMREVWFSILSKLTAKVGVDLFGKADGGTWSEDNSSLRISVEECRMSLVTYVSKRNSKQAIFLNGEFVTPRRWYGISNALRRDMDRERVSEIVFVPEGQVIPFFERIKLLIGKRWSVLRNPYRKINIGWKAKLAFDEVARARTSLCFAVDELCRQFDLEISDRNTLITVKLVLNLNGRCQLKVGERSTHPIFQVLECLGTRHDTDIEESS